MRVRENPYSGIFYTVSTGLWDESVTVVSGSNAKKGNSVHKETTT